MRIIQFQIPGQGRRLGVVDQDQVLDITSVDAQLDSTLKAFEQAFASGTTLSDFLGSVIANSSPDTLSYETLWNARDAVTESTLLAPLDHPDTHHCLITGTGLTHLGSMESRDQMHTIDTSAEAESKKSDSRKMFEMGLRDGKPPSGQRGVAPEWFYKGNGFNLRAHQQTLEIPSHARDGGEEPEFVGCYVIASDGSPHRLGFALGNEWSDHATENINYLYLAPSKLRTCAIGPELITDCGFAHIDLSCTVERNGEPIYSSGPLLSGEDHMCHSLANCEDHHFKYAQHRIAGDVHLHYFGTSKLSHSTRDWQFADGDRIEISAPAFSSSLVNHVHRSEPDDSPYRVQGLMMKG
jgi:hypothetical protein